MRTMKGMSFGLCDLHNTITTQLLMHNPNLSSHVKRNTLFTCMSEEDSAIEDKSNGK